MQSSTQPQTNDAVVSSDAEQLILVDSSDQETGQLAKAQCHDGDGVLHRAFSAFIFDRKGRLLVQRRASGKRLWPGYWSNSCCSHPRAGETMPFAVSRRLQQELGFAEGQVQAQFVYKFEYKARYGDAGSEHELCWVFVAHTDAQPVINTTEIDDWTWLDPEEVTARLAAQPDAFTPWFKDEWARLTRDYPAVLVASNT